MIIKCPECGHQVSDKAPVCPSCGVEIAGHIVKCANCGEIHLLSDGICPNCHHSLTRNEIREEAESTAALSVEHVMKENPDNETDGEQPQATTLDIVEPSDYGYDADDTTDGEEPDTAETDETEEMMMVNAVPLPHKESPTDSNKKRNSGNTKAEAQKPKPKKSHTALIVSFIIAALLCIGLLYAYQNGSETSEYREYSNAVETRDPNVLKAYLNSFPNAPASHRDSVQAILNVIRSSDPEWEAAVKANNVEALQQYVDDNPNSPHRQEALDMMDELDWKVASSSHDFANYLSLHQNGKHAAEAADSVKKDLTLPADGIDRDKAVNSVRSLLVGINTRNEDRIRNAVAGTLAFFNEKSSVAGPDEAVGYMRYLYKDANRLNWYIDNASAAKVNKKGNGEKAEYELVVPARLSVNYKSGNNVQAKYNVLAHVNGSGNITAIKFLRLAETAPQKAPETVKKKQ